jgi:SAM-dependent methyltransferase
MSVDFYDRNADAFFSSTVGLDMGAIRARFLAHLPAGARVLDAGCGSGRDALAFHQAGYAVDAFDASEQLVDLARGYTGLPIKVLKFADLAWDAEFDGIWASASLLHVPRLELPGVFATLVRALRPAGVIYISMKRGRHDREVDGRLFVDLVEQELAGLLEGASLTIADAWVSQSVRPERAEESWVNAIARKPLAAERCS